MLRRLIAVNGTTAVVVAFPRGRQILESGQAAGGVLEVQTIAARKEPAERGLKLGFFRDVADDRAERLELAPALGHDHAERLTGVEADGLTRSRQLPVHGEGRDSP